MGSLCSKSSDQHGGHQVLASGLPVGHGGRSPGHLEARRKAAATAAESRMQKEQNRGTQLANPNRGKLSQKLVASSSNPKSANQSQQEEEPLRWD